MLVYLVIFQVSAVLHQYLHGTPALDNQCSNQNNIGQNYFVGDKYFYNYITKNGQEVDFSKLTFILWIKFVDNNPFKQYGKQIIFQLVDGSDDNPYINMQLSVFAIKGQLYLSLQGGDIQASSNPQYKMSLSGVANAKQLLGWNQMVVSIDQSMPTSYLNIKLYDSFKNTNYQFQVPNINVTIFTYTISQQTRITNEVFLGQYKIDTRACAFIANFHYYIGWTTMDTEPILDYSSQQVFYLKPVNGNSLNSMINNIAIKNKIGVAYDSTNKSLNIFKNTRLEYAFKQQMDSFVMAFWMNPKITFTSEIENYQLFSFTDDSILQTALGFGINNQLKLLMYQGYDSKQIGQLQSGWTHIIAYVMQNTWNNDFIPQSDKLMTVYVNGINITQFKVDNIFQWSRIVIGILFQDDKDANYVQMKEIQIYSGMSLYKSKFGCLFKSDDYCILCDPINSQFTYTASACPQQQQSNYQSCQSGTTSCNITVSQGLVKFYPILCQDLYIYKQQTCTTPTGPDAGLNCILQMNKGCFNCQVGYALKTLSSGATRCIPECTGIKDGLYNFNDNGVCKQVCPYYATYQYDCAKNVTIVQCYNQCPKGYKIVNNGICQHPDFAPIQALKSNDTFIKGLINDFTNYTPSPIQKNYATQKFSQFLHPDKIFDPDETYVQNFLGCQQNIPIQYNVTQQCIYPCGLCYYSTKTSCLTCQDPNQFLDRQFTSCVKSCEQSLGILKLNHRLTMTCEQTCPQGYYKQEIECVASCSQNYYLYSGVCTKTIPLGYYINNNIITPCPQVCKTCSSSSNCLTCIGNYPKNGNMCVTKCPLWLDFETNTCVTKCQSSDLIYSTFNLNGFAFKVCFKNRCGFVQANKQIQTVQHQTNLLQCAQPCDDTYYADYGELKCKKCKSPCLTCQDNEEYCLTCIKDYFFYQNNCYQDCSDMYEDTINYECVGGCDEGYTLQINGIKACVKNCDSNKYGLVAYYHEQQCLATPKIGTYCIGHYCYDCDSSCYTCNGPDDDQCLSCNNLYLYNNMCNTDCPSNQYSVTTTWTCQPKCPVGTFTMDSQRGCYNPCPSKTYQYNKKCYDIQQQSTYCNLVQQTYVCSDCYSTCFSCTDKASNSCTECKAGYNLWQGQCLTKCPKGSFKHDQQCLTQCPMWMRKQEDSCVWMCDPGYISFSDRCATTCPQGFYKSFLTCFPCFIGCATCTQGDQDSCQSCSTGFYLSGTTCKTSCPANYPFCNQMSNSCEEQCPDTGFIDAQPDATYCVLLCPKYYYGRICQTQCPYKTWAKGYECRVCDRNCTVCFGDLVSQCSSCISGSYLDQQTCVEKCPIQRPMANQVDKKCVASCPQYTYLEQMYCFANCPTYLYRYELKPGNLECVKTCYPRSYVSGQYCLACAPQCIYCYAANTHSCLKCSTGYYLSGTTCQSTCPTLQDEVNLTCVPNCDPTLYQLNNRCLSSCPVNYQSYLMKCVGSCPPVTYLSNKQCLPCHYSCLVCQDGTNKTCQQCISNYFMNGTICTLTCPILYDYINYKCVNGCPEGSYLLDNQCLQTCPFTYLTVQDKSICVKKCETGYYQDGIQCLKCDSACTQCTAIDKCQNCAENYALNIDKCVSICWLNEKLFQDTVNRKCQSICPNYHYSGYGKYICVDECDQYYSDKFCVDQCQFGQYGNEQNVCTLCPTNCRECSAIDNCTSCDANFILTKGQCSNSCINQYLDVSTNQCVDACPLNKYLLEDKCLIRCPTPSDIGLNAYFAYNFVCYQQCPVATFRSEQYCLDCSPECSKCYGPTSSDCESCSKGYYLYNQICTKTCPVNYFYDQQQFVCTFKCDKNLFELDDKCLEVCPILSYYEQCVDSCPLHTYQYNLVCQDCKSICLTCNQFECLSCVGGYFLNDGVCDQVCPHFYDQVNKKCVNQCDQTLFIFMDSCLQNCPNLPTYSYQQKCLLECPGLTARVGTTCQQCQERCQVCQNQSFCLQCQEGYNLHNGVCLVACPMASPYLENGFCSTKCSDTTFYYQNNCVIQCPNKQYLQQCVDECPDGYYGDVCSPCKSQCKTCSSYQTCSSCNPNYFLEETVCDTQCPFIYDTIKWECTDTCQGLLNGLFCVSLCPAGLVQQGSFCQIFCEDGFYNENGICIKCPRECQLCTSVSSCQSCSISYFLLNQSCLSICPLGSFSDPKSNKCVLECTSNMFKYQTQCLFSCPKGYVANKSECTQECSHNQLQIGQSCKDCPLECDGCSGLTNSDCIKCSKNTIKLEKFCLSTSCISGYTLFNGFCQQCSFNCLTCDQNSCLSCRGDRATTQCTCVQGYFDDGVSDQCQTCSCDECTSINSCTKCQNNLKTPNCSCDRQLNSDWCIDCNVGRTNIQFSYDLNSIIVDFGYLISINLINPFSPSSCELWMINSEILGIGSLCHLVWDRTQVIIQLGLQATVTIGDQLEFQQNFYKDVNDQECEGFIRSFIDSSVKQPDLMIKPYVEFDNPYLISNCKEIKIKQISIMGTGQRELQILQWKIINQQDLEEDHFYQISDYLQQMGNYLQFDMNVLKPNQTYVIQAKYINILKKLNTTILTFKTNTEQKPYVYLTFNPLTAHAYIFDCKSFQDFQLTYTLSILIQKENDTLLSENMLVVNKYFIVVDESKLPRGQQLLVTAQIDEKSIKQNFTLQLLPHLLQFKEESRFLGLEGRITARGFDQNINDLTISQMNFKYQWVCTNLHNLQPCKSKENQIIKFVDTRILQIQIDSPNTTFAFYCNASKDNRWTVEVQKIVITNLNIENNYVENTGNVLGNINPNDDVFIILKQPQQYAMIMYKYLLVDTIKIYGFGIKFKLADQLNESHGDVTIYLLPSNDSLKYSIDSIQLQGQLDIDPKEGYSLDEFTITMNILNIDQLDVPMKYGFFQYLKQSQLEVDVANYQTVHGLPLGQFQSNNNIKAFLTSGLDQLFILCQVIDRKGFVTFFNQAIMIKRKHFTYKDLINALPKQNQTLQQINAVLSMLNEESKQVCLRQCSGVGTCIQGRCKCPPGYYFDDCSGSIEDSKVQKQYLLSTLQELFNTPIVDDEYYKLFIKSLSYLSNYQDSFEHYNSEKALVQLGIVSESLSNRINKINQFTINLQFNQLENLQHDSLDLGQIVQMEDLQQTMYCHDLIWYIVLQNKTGNDKYQIQYQTRQIIQQIIQLSFYILKPDDFVDFSGAGGTLLINRSNQSIIKTSSGRMLSTTNHQYDLVQAKYMINLYSEDGYFPYPKQQHPLYDYSIRLVGRQQNIILQYTINYIFEVESQNRYICIMRNSTNYGWEYQNCNTTYVNKSIYCNCTKLAPTTIVNDMDYLVFGMESKRIKFPNFIILVLLVQTGLWICLLMIGLRKDRQILNSQIVHNQSTSIKYGVVKKLNKYTKRSLNLYGVKIDQSGEQITPDPLYDNNDQLNNVAHKTDHDDELLANDRSNDELISNNRNVSQKYSLENFQKQHSILNIIYKYKKFQPRWFRSTLILMRWTICIALSGLFVYLQLLYEVSVYPTLGAFLFSRMIESFINQQFKQISYIDSVVLKLVYITFILVMIIFSLMGFWYIFSKLTNETDWIISYLISFFIDISFLDLISMIANKYLGQDLKIRLRKRIKRIKEQHEMQKQIKSSEQLE